MMVSLLATIPLFCLFFCFENNVVDFVLLLILILIVNGYIYLFYFISLLLLIYIVAEKPLWGTSIKCMNMYMYFCTLIYFVYGLHVINFIS